MDAGQAFSRIKDAVLYVYDALADFVLSIDPDFIFTTLMPFLNWVVLGAAALILLEACVRYLLDASETVLVLLLYTLGLPVMLLGLLRRGQNAPAEVLSSPTAEELQPAQPAVLDLTLFRRLSWREPEQPDGDTIRRSPSPAERVDTALFELGVPLTASDDEIRHAYRALIKDHHPDRIPNAPTATRERARQMTLQIRCAYDTAMGRRGSRPEM